jgi:hypothetical protein
MRNMKYLNPLFKALFINLPISLEYINLYIEAAFRGIIKKYMFLNSIMIRIRHF